MKQKYKVSFKNIISIKRGKSLSGIYYSKNGNIIRLSLANFYEEGGFKESNKSKNIYYVGEYEEGDLLLEGELITPLTEQVKGLIGSVARIPEGNKYLPCGDIGIMKIINEKIVDKNYIYHLFKSEYIRKQLVKGAQKSKIRHVSPDDFYDIECKIPSIEEQIKIAKLLDNIDKKIDVNNKINDNLSYYSIVA